MDVKSSQKIKQNATYLKNIIIQKHHNDAGDIEGPQGRVYNIVLVVEQAVAGAPVCRVVEAQHDRRANRTGHQPRYANHRPDACVAFVLRVFDWLCYCYVSGGERIIMYLFVNFNIRYGRYSSRCNLTGC